MATSDSGNSAQLAGISVNDLERGFWGKVTVEVHGAHLRRKTTQVWARPCHQLTDETMTCQYLGIRFEVLIHDKFLEREERQMDVSFYRPALVRNNCFTHFFEKSLEIII